MKLRFKFRKIVVMLLLVLIAGVASADTVTYTYAGNQLQNFVGAPPDGVAQIQFSFALANPLAANLNFSFDGIGNLQPSNVSILSSSLSAKDGVSTLTQNSGRLFLVQLETDSTGSIIHWFLIATDSSSFDTSSLMLGSVFHPDYGAYDFSCRGTAPNCENFSFLKTDLGDVSVAQDNAGTWSVQPDSTAVPEPSSLVLLGSGLLSIAGMVRRKILS